MKNYHIIGRPYAGSLIVEFLFNELNINYDISFIDKNECKGHDFLKKNPLGRIPILECKDGSVVFESVAIINYLTDNYDLLVPKIGDPLRNRYNQFLSLIATTVYQSYHRQYHTYQYGSENCYKNIREDAKQINDLIYDYFNKQLTPYMCGDMLTAVDFYLFMMCMFESEKQILFNKYPNISNHFKMINSRKSVLDTLNNQPKIEKSQDNISWKLNNKRYKKIKYIYDTKN